MRKFDSPAPDVVKSSVKEDKTMVSEAQNRANAKYRKAHERQYSFVLIDSTRPKMIKYLDEMTDKRAYMRRLIAMDMKAKGIETDGLDGEMEETP